MMGMSRAAYYYRPKDKAERKKRDRDLSKRIKAICYRFPFYGYRRVTAALKRNGVTLLIPTSAFLLLNQTTKQ
jgi:putative transposase